MSIRIQFRRGTTSEWSSANPVLALGEIGIDTTTTTLKVGNGSSAWSALTGFELVASGAFLADIVGGAREIAVGSGSGTMQALAGSGSGVNVIRAASGEALGVERVTFDTGILSGFDGSGAVSGDLLRYNGTVWEPVTFQEFLTAIPVRTVQNLALRQAGYFSRGASTTTVYKWTFPADTVSTTTASLVAMNSHAGFANPGIAGYFSRGNSWNVVEKWLFPGDTVTTTTSAPAGMTTHAGFANPSIAGYFSRGNTTTTVYKWGFPADTVTTTTAAPDTMNVHAGFANPAVAGYFFRGDGFTTVYKWTFPADTASTTTAAPATMSTGGGFANPAVAGYFARGNGITVYKWAFPADTVSSTTSAPEIMAVYNHSGMANPAVAGYFPRMWNISGQNFPTLYKWTFPADTVSTTTSFPANPNANAGFANA